MKTVAARKMSRRVLRVCGVGGAAAFAAAVAAPAAAAEPSPPDPVAAAPLSADPAADHLRRGLELMAKGDYAGAKLEFETVLRLDDLPADLHAQAEVYADAARAYLGGSRWLPSGYALVGFGNYHENDTVAGSGDTDDMFFSARVGGRLNYVMTDANALNLSLDYRYRNYDNAGRRDDSDLRWNANFSHGFGDNNLAVGVRGRASYRGNGQTRNDYGVFGTVRFLGDPTDQFNLGVEFRRRNYPQGPLRARSRNILEFTGGWTHTLADGKASFSLAAGGGREFATDNRPDGDSNFFNLSPTFNFTLSEHWGGYVFAWWQTDRYNVERTNSEGADDVLGITTRNDDLWEIGGGLTWEFGRGWSLNPEILYTEDKSNILALNYSSTELHLTLRKDF